MYGYYEHLNITPEQLLQKVTREQIFEFALGQKIQLYKKYRSPFREDKNAGCFFSLIEGALIFVDYADRDNKKRRSCFGMVMDLYRVDLTGALQIICDHFGLSKNNKDYERTQTHKTYNKEEEINRPDTIITYDKKEYTHKDKLHWSQWLIKIDELEEDKVYSVSKFTKTNHKGTIIIRPHSYCYAIDFIHHVKIYQPYSDYKWMTNCDEDDIGNIDNLPPTGEYLIIQKSYKDHRVLRNNGYSNVIWFMSEGIIPSLHILKNLLSRFKRIVIFYDNDYHGIKSAYSLSLILKGLQNSNNTIEIKYLPINCGKKDLGEYINREGRKELLKILEKMKL